MVEFVKSVTRTKFCSDLARRGNPNVAPELVRQSLPHSAGCSFRAHASRCSASLQICLLWSAVTPTPVILGAASAAAFSCALLYCKNQDLEPLCGFNQFGVFHFRSKVSLYRCIFAFESLLCPLRYKPATTRKEEATIRRFALSKHIQS
jgi:hypothetical protein